MHGTPTAVSVLLACLLASWLVAPAAAQVRMENPDRNLQISLGGWIQPRYEFSLVEDGDNLSSFYLRRVRIELRGTVLTPQLTFRVMPELNRSAALRDGWVNYAFSPSAQVRIGQFELPFQWHRHIGPRRQHFAERGMASETIGFPDARDVGVMLHGIAPDRRWEYGVAVLDGAGRNVQYSNSDGHLVSARGSIGVLGPVPIEESDLAHSPAPGLSVGVGVQAATKSDVRAWDLGRSATANRRADWVSTTADLSLRAHGLSLASDGYLRWVNPDDDAVESYMGTAVMVTAGYMVVPSRVEVVARYSVLRLDRDDADTQGSEWGAGFNLYHRGHDLKTRVQYLHRTEPMVESSVSSLIVELHVQF